MSVGIMKGMGKEGNVERRSEKIKRIKKKGSKREKIRKNKEVDVKRRREKEGKNKKGKGKKENEEKAKKTCKDVTGPYTYTA